MIPCPGVVASQQPAGAPVWSPADIASATLVAWYDAENVTLVDTDKVSQMDDLSGNANHATQDTAADRPTWDQDGSSRGRISFVSGSPHDHFDIPSFFTGAALRSVFLFCSVGASTMIFSLGPATTGNRWAFRTISGALRIEIQGSGITTGLTPSGEQFMGIILHTASNQHNLYLDVSSAAANTSAVNTSAGDAYIGHGSTTGANPITTLREVVVCDGVLSPAEISLLRDYMVNRWG